jgi:hypothetical protein
MSIVFSQPFLAEIKSLALQIASSQRAEEHMQDIETLHVKFGREQVELAGEDAKGERGEQWDELPDVTYYPACMVIVAPEHAHTQEALSWLSQDAERRGITVAQLEAGTLAKYRLRVMHAGESKEDRLLAERKVTLSAVAAV